MLKITENIRNNRDALTRPMSQKEPLKIKGIVLEIPLNGFNGKERKAKQ